MQQQVNLMAAQGSSSFPEAASAAVSQGSGHFHRLEGVPRNPPGETLGVHPLSTGVIPPDSREYHPPQHNISEARPHTSDGYTMLAPIPLALQRGRRPDEQQQPPFPTSVVIAHPRGDWMTHQAEQAAHRPDRMSAQAEPSPAREWMTQHSGSHPQQEWMPQPREKRELMTQRQELVTQPPGSRSSPAPALRIRTNASGIGGPRQFDTSLASQVGHLRLFQCQCIFLFIILCLHCHCCCPCECRNR